MRCQRFEIRPGFPDPRALRIAGEALKAGRVVAFPTDSVYALGCSAFEKRSAELLLRIKDLDRDHPLTLMCRDIGEAARYVTISDTLFRPLRKLTPGPYCFVLQATKQVPKVLRMRRKEVGIRIPDDPVCQGLMQELDGPLLTTSAGHGDAVFVDPSDIASAYGEVAVLLDSGAGGYEPSSVVDMTQEPPQVLRAGAGDVSLFED